MTIRVIVTVIYSKEFHLDISQFQAIKALKNILLELNHTFSKIERKIFRMDLSFVDHCEQATIPMVYQSHLNPLMLDIFWLRSLTFVKKSPIYSKYSFLNRNKGLVSTKDAPTISEKLMNKTHNINYSGLA